MHLRDRYSCKRSYAPSTSSAERQSSLGLLIHNQVPFALSRLSALRSYSSSRDCQISQSVRSRPRPDRERTREATAGRICSLSPQHPRSPSKGQIQTENRACSSAERFRMRKPRLGAHRRESVGFFLCVLGGVCGVPPGDGNRRSLLLPTAEDTGQLARVVGDIDLL